MQESGFEISTPPLSTLAKCPTLTTINNFEGEVINFGYDMSTSCVISLNRSELKKFCCEGGALCDPTDSVYSQSTGVPVFLSQISG